MSIFASSILPRSRHLLPVTGDISRLVDGDSFIGAAICANELSTAVHNAS